MMFPFRRRPTPKPASQKRKNEAAAMPPNVISELHPQHVDYDLQPVRVEGLSHYIEPIVETERFRVH
ncbi:hypothetical protein [Dyella choica]|uniref:Uncharacterized protein n=1 Tax=Dyella choica TaxID=1927959 RepID=A0A3S0RNL7_9GAMM|nr:hypothetical protein [Dyella choica]RUL80079.1 hypothetical protein EKH80_02500 [Dyella choica]